MCERRQALGSFVLYVFVSLTGSWESKNRLIDVSSVVERKM